MDRDAARPTRLPLLRRPAARWTIMPLIGVVLAGVLIVALTGFFQRRAASSATNVVETPSKPIYLTWADQQGYALGARDGANGHLLWRDPIEGITNGAPLGLTLADGTLYLYGAVRDTVSQAQAGITMTAIRAGDGHVLWHVALANQLDSDLAPVVANGNVYATQLQETGNDQTGFVPASVISAFRVTDGHKLWDYAPGLRVSAMPSRANTLYLVESAQRGAPLSTQVEAMNATTGRLIWRSPLMEGEGGPSAMLGSTSMLVTTAQFQKEIAGSGGPVFASSGFLHVIDLATGKQLWEVPGGQEIQATFDATGATIYATLSDNQLNINQSRFPPSVIAAFDAKTGTKLWQYTADGASSAPVVSGTLVYFTRVLSTNTGSRDANSLTALDAGKGSVQWQKVNALPQVANTGVSSVGVNPPQVLQGAVFTFMLSANDETLVTAFDAQSGHSLWSVDFGQSDKPVYSIGTPHPDGPERLLVTPGVVYAVAGPSRATTAIRAGDGKTLWTFTTQQNTASLIVGG